MDEVSSLLGPAVNLTARPPGRLFRLVFESHDGRAWCRFRREARARSDIDTAVVVDGLKVLDPEWPIREEARARERHRHCGSGWSESA